MALLIIIALRYLKAPAGSGLPQFPEKSRATSYLLLLISASLSFFKAVFDVMRLVVHYARGALVSFSYTSRSFTSTAAPHTGSLLDSIVSASARRQDGSRKVIKNPFGPKADAIRSKAQKKRSGSPSVDDFDAKLPAPDAPPEPWMPPESLTLPPPVLDVPLRSRVPEFTMVPRTPSSPPPRLPPPVPDVPLRSHPNARPKPWTPPESMMLPWTPHPPPQSKLAVPVKTTVEDRTSVCLTLPPSITLSDLGRIALRAGARPADVVGLWGVVVVNSVVNENEESGWARAVRVLSLPGLLARVFSTF